MAAITGSLLIAGASAYAADQQGEAGRDVARGATQANELQRQNHEQIRADQTPYLQAGYRGLNEMRRLNEGDFSSFTESPDYQFARDQGIKALDRSASARGTQYSGGQLAALADYSSGLATQNYGNYYNRIAQLAGMGQNASGIVAGSGANYANQAGANLMNAANAQADARVAQAGTYGQLGGQLMNSFGQWHQSRNASPGVAPLSNAQWQSAYSQVQTPTFDIPKTNLGSWGRARG